MNIALIAHDGRKKEMIEWVKYNHETLSRHKLYATGTTGRLIKNLKFKVEIDEYNQTIIKEIEPFKNNVTCLLSGPLGGDAEASAMIANGKLDVLIFFCDNLIVQGHNSDIQGLSRLASLYNIAFATNRTTADMILTSSLFNNNNYKRILPEAIENYANRKL